MARIERSEPGAGLHSEDDEAEKGSILEAVESGDEREILVAVRDRLAKLLDSPKTAARDSVPLAKQLLALDKEIRLIDEKEAMKAGPREQFRQDRGPASLEEPFRPEAI